MYVYIYIHTHTHTYIYIYAAQVEKAAGYLLESARAAIRECAFREGINMLHQACRVLDRVAVTVGTARLKLDLLSELAPQTLLLYGHGSPEAMAAYNGLMMLVSDSGVPVPKPVPGAPGHTPKEPYKHAKRAL